MEKIRIGQVIKVNANMVTVEVAGQIIQNEVAYIVHGQERLKAEVIRVRQNRAEMQVYESTQGLKAGDVVELSGELLSVELGPGLLGQIFDGLQNPLPALAEKCGFFLKRGVYLEALPDETQWDFTPLVEPGKKVLAGSWLGFVPEKIFKHYIMVPFALGGSLEVVNIATPGKYNLKQVIAQLRDSVGGLHDVFLQQIWPVKIPIQAYAEKLRPTEPLVTKMRLIDSLFPVNRGGTYCIPVVETLKTFPELLDPRTHKPLIDRTVIICNTSSMPVAARESSVYTAVTIAEYYRQMGLNILLLADSTSRWAQAMREMSGRLEEIPGEEAFPAYLESRIASFYERAGVVRLQTGATGSVTIGGAVSPAGGNFEEPVTQATLKVVGAFHGLSRERSDARKYPAIDPLISWSKYTGFVNPEYKEKCHSILQRSNEIAQMMKVIGEEGTSLKDYIEYLKGDFFDFVYLQQNAFDLIDEATSKERQIYLLEFICAILDAQYNLEDKASALHFFQSLRQLMRTWNSAEYNSSEFKTIESQISMFLETKLMKKDR
ncbi:MAG: V-type ATP synthase subunit A [Candidatus Omnitrophica bacterium]|nr:V-type ATP synthase subunit A [Candidatus Omnitrophota bacterium]